MTWNGGNNKSDIEIESLDGKEINFASSHFGSGILTWNLPFLFRTPPGYNLQVRGPANWPKDGAYALEGIVETDWLESTFTMNWKLTRADLPVVFEADEPICMIVPQRRGELEAFEPEIREIGEQPELAGAFQRWAESRGKFNRGSGRAGFGCRQAGLAEGLRPGHDPRRGQGEGTPDQAQAQGFRRTRVRCAVFVTESLRG